MKILFLLSAIGLQNLWHPGVASIATFLRHNGYRTDLLEVNEFNLRDIEKEVKHYKPDVIAATANSHQFSYITRILKHVKSFMPGVYQVLGGVHVTIDPFSLQELEFVDAVCRGEGERPLLELVDTLERGKEPGLIGIENMSFPAKDKGKIRPCKYYIADLDELPISDRDLFKVYREAEQNNAILRPRFLFCRGCPYNCSYCCNKVLKENFPSGKPYVRRPSVKKAIEEICMVSRKYRFSDYVIDDDVFTLKKSWVMEFCDKYPSELINNKRFELNIRIGTVDKEMMKALKEVGCCLMKFGLESGDEEIRNQVLNRRITNEKIMETVALANECGVPLHTFNMIGIPGENRWSIFKTIHINRKIRPERLQVTIFYPYPNTELGECCLNRNLVIGKGDSYFKESVINHDNLSRLEIKIVALLFKLFVYSGYSIKKSLGEMRSILIALIPLKNHLLPFLRYIRSRILNLRN